MNLSKVARLIVSRERITETSRINIAYFIFWILFLLLRLLLDRRKYLGVLQDLLIVHGTVKNDIIKEYHSRFCTVLSSNFNSQYNFMTIHSQYSDTPVVLLIRLKTNLIMLIKKQKIKKGLHIS